MQTRRSNELFGKELTIRNCVTFKFREYLTIRQIMFLKSQLRPTGKVFVYKIQVNSIHTIVKYGIFYDFMDR